MDGSDSTAHAEPTEPRSRGAAALAEAVLDGTSPRPLKAYIDDLASDATTTATRSARVVEEVIERQPALGAPFIAKLVQLLASDNPRVVQACANTLPLLGRAAPAKVAKRMPALTAHFEDGDEVVQDGVMRTFIALCAASVAYQKRLIALFDLALRNAPPQAIAAWTPALLPTLKGEPYAQARETLEQRLPQLPPAQAQQVADFLGIKLRRSIA